MEIEEEMKWVADLKQQLLPLTEVFEEEIWMKQCIYRVPARVKDISVKAFEPQMVSFGPYHHGKPNLEPMEYHKRRALYRFLERTDKPLEEFGAALEEVVEELMDSYEYLEERWRDKDQFLPLMLFDGCFLLEVMRGPSENYSQYDPIFSVHGVLNTFHYIVPDMMMVENQVPLLALARLWALSNGISFEEGESAINARVTKLFFPGLTLMETRMGLHILDVFRKAVIQDPWTRVPFDPNLDAPQSLRSATDLHEAGVIFRRSATYSVKDISFQNGVLTMPVFVIERSSETIYFNTIAFERLRPEAGHDIRTYIIFMFGLANSTEDVVFLKSQGLIQSTLGSNEAVADLLNLLSRDIFFDPSNRLSLIRDALNEYYILNMNKWRKRMRDWRKNLKLNYFNSPWALISVIAAGAVLLVTLAQTYYTILSYYQGNPK